MRKYDVIYILKDGGDYEELRYSLRSIETNMTHGDVWFYGATPRGFVPDHAVRFEQRGLNKWAKVRSTLLAICNDENVPGRFWLFNDDFFIMQRMNTTKAAYNETIRDHYESVERRHGGRSNYTRALRLCEQELKARDLPTLDYAVHFPMLIDKDAALDTLLEFPGCPMFRSLYGNYNNVDGIHRTDCKIVELNARMEPEAAFLSTSNKSFKLGEVGKQIREAFPDPCKYEAGYNG